MRRGYKERYCRKAEHYHIPCLPKRTATAKISSWGLAVCESIHFPFSVSQTLYPRALLKAKSKEHGFKGDSWIHYTVLPCCPSVGSGIRVILLPATHSSVLLSNLLDTIWNSYEVYFASIWIIETKISVKCQRNSGCLQELVVSPASCSVHLQ